MKKLTVILIITATLCSYVSCGQDNADEITDESYINSVAEVSEEETTEEIIKSETPIEEFSEENNSETSEELSGDVSCKDAVKMLID